MKSGLRMVLATMAAAAALVVTSCASENHLDSYDFAGSTLAAEVARAPEPRMDVSYHFGHNHDDVIGTTLGVLTNIAMADQAGHAERTMRGALDDVDVPSIVKHDALDACARALGAEARDSKHDAEFLLSLEIEDWGISAHSGFGSVSLQMHVTASLYHGMGGLVWRRSVDVDQAASPEMFGIPGVIGTMVTTNQLYEMTEADLVRGFTELARHVARKTSRLLEDDLDAARNNW